MNCEKVVCFQESTQYRIEFLGDFETQHCTFDFIEIWNGDDANYNLIMKACGTEKPKTKILSGHSVRIRFKSDFLFSAKGFAIQVQQLKHSESKTFNIW